VVISEILTATPAIRSLIREGKSHQIPSFMQAGGNEGMLSFDQHLAERVREGLVSIHAALEICHSQEELKRLIGRM
jgi:twitching motility protein PilT